MQIVGARPHLQLVGQALVGDAAQLTVEGVGAGGERDSGAQEQPLLALLTEAHAGAHDHIPEPTTAGFRTRTRGVHMLQLFVVEGQGQHQGQVLAEAELRAELVLVHVALDGGQGEALIVGQLGRLVGSAHAQVIAVLVVQPIAEAHIAHLQLRGQARTQGRFRVGARGPARELARFLERERQHLGQAQILQPVIILGLRGLGLQGQRQKQGAENQR